MLGYAWVFMYGLKYRFIIYANLLVFYSIFKISQI